MDRNIAEAHRLETSSKEQVSEPVDDLRQGRSHHFPEQDAIRVNRILL